MSKHHATWQLLVPFALFVFTRLAVAHPFSPPSLDGVAHSDTVYLVHVNSTNKDGVSFTITEVLKGQSRCPLILNPFGNNYPTNSEWILVHNSSGFKNCVGWALKGDCEWLPIRISTEGGRATAQWLGALDTVREYIHQHRY
jgi:hypothetical protein